MTKYEALKKIEALALELMATEDEEIIAASIIVASAHGCLQDLKAMPAMITFIRSLAVSRLALLKAAQP